MSTFTMGILFYNDCSYFEDARIQNKKFIFSENTQKLIFIFKFPYLFFFRI